MFGELHDRSPRQIGPYRVLARLGAGGMGEVYLGADLRPRPAGTSPQLAAVKIVRAELSGAPAFRDRFRREIETARSVRSRFTARLLSGDADAAEPWLATEYVAGPTLERAVRDTGPLPVETVRSLGLGLARAVRGIHHAHVQHRDLKPANVLLGADGPRVIDFGIARDFGAGTLTETGAMFGSPGHMSPEHVLGGRHVVAASDVFCLASLLCFAATGESPFGGGPVAAVLYRISQAEADLTAVPAQVRDLIEDCLSLDPASRPDAAELESRFREGRGEGRGGGGGGGGGEGLGSTSDEDVVAWPPAVRTLVTRYEDELDRVVAAAGPLASPVPTMPGASPVHSAETVTAPPPTPPGETGPPPTSASQEPRTRPSRRTVLVVLAAALAVGVLGAFGLRALDDDPPPAEASRTGGGSPSPSASPEPTAVQPPVGLGEHGKDGSRYFPADPAARPAGWKPWITQLSSRPMDCVLHPEVLVCRTSDGALEALGAADGETRWKAPSADPGRQVSETPQGVLLMPGGATNPVLQGDTVVSFEGGKARGRSVSDGTVRWEQPVENMSPRARVVVGGGAAYFTTYDEGVVVEALDVATGKRLWKRTVSTRTGVSSIGSHYTATGFAGGRVIVTSDRGLVGFAARTGKVTRYSTENGGDCGVVRISPGHVLCGQWEKRGVTLDEKTLKPVADPAWDSLPDGTAFDGHVAAGAPITVGDTAYWLGWADDGTRIALQKEGADAPRTVGSYRRGKEREFRRSVASIVGDTAVVADNEFLNTLPVNGGDRQRFRIKGSPGNDYRVSGAGLNLEVWAPELISLGGVLFLAYHDGTVRSLELPTP
ncbi:protein kinase domain-containing protein [Streptomyces sp. O3]